MSHANVVSPLFNNFATNKDLEKNGIVLQYGFTTRKINGEDVKVPVDFTIARAGGNNTHFDKVFETLTKPYKRMIQMDALDPEIGKQIMIEAFSIAVVKGWNNVQDQTGEFIEYSRANVVKLLTALPDLFADIQVQANKQALFRNVAVEEDAKN